MKPRTKVLPAICVNLCPSVANTLPIYAIMGPTASGKTALGVELARRVGGEVINCDSVQICRRTNVATAKPSDANWRVARRKDRGDRVTGGGGYRYSLAGLDLLADEQLCAHRDLSRRTAQKLSVSVCGLNHPPTLAVVERRYFRERCILTADRMHERLGNADDPGRISGRNDR